MALREGAMAVAWWAEPASHVEELDSEHLVEIESEVPTMRCPVGPATPAPESNIRIRVSSADEVAELKSEVRRLTEVVLSLVEAVGRVESMTIRANAETMLPPPPRVPVFAMETTRPAKGAW